MNISAVKCNVAAHDLDSLRGLSSEVRTTAHRKVGSELMFSSNIAQCWHCCCEYDTTRGYIVGGRPGHWSRIFTAKCNTLETFAKRFKKGTVV